MNLGFLFEDKKFFREMFRIAVPITVQNLALASLNLVDTIIIGGLGEVAIASVGLANQYFFLLNLLLFGIASGSSIFTAQYWGCKDIPNIKRVLGLCLITGGAGALIFTVCGLLFPEQILGFFSRDAQVITLGGQYLRIIVLSYVITAVTFSFSFTLRSTGQVKVPMFVSLVALSVNTALNYILVYGYLGMPAMGIRGSAIATLIARIIEVVMILSIIYGRKMVVAAKPRELFDLSAAFVARFFKVTFPVILNESIWACGVTMYAFTYAHMGTQVIASTNISGTVERIMWVFFMGFGNSCGVMLGNSIGANKEKEAYLMAKRFIILGPAAAMLVGGVMIFFSSHLLSAYKVSPEVYGFAQKNLVVYCSILWAKVFNYITIVGILRSGGDTNFCLLLDAGGVWLVGVPLALMGGLVWHLPIYFVYALVNLEELFKITLGLPRILSKKWLNNLTEEAA